MKYTIWTHQYVCDDAANHITCNVSFQEWSKIHEEHSSARRIFARCVIGETEIICPLGEPMEAAEMYGNHIFFPTWHMNAFETAPLGEEHEVEWITDEYFPPATRIVLRPHDTAFYDADTKNELELALTQYGVLRSGTTIPIEIQALDRYIIQFSVICTEPSNLVLMEGDDIDIEFENAHITENVVDVCAEPAVITPPALELPMLPDMPAFFAQQTPSPFKGEGQMLGSASGVVRPTMPDGRPWNPWR